MSTSLLVAAGGSPFAPGAAAAAVQTRHTAASSTVVDGIFEEPNVLNPVLGPSMTYAEMVEETLFRNLFQVQPNGTIQPDLATQIPTVKNGGMSKNGLTYVIHIKPNASWSNGQPVSAQDVITTWHDIMSPSVTAQSTVGWSDIKDIQAVSTKEIRVTLNAPDASFLTMAFGAPDSIIPASVFGKMPAAQVMKAAFNHNPTVTDGPYLFKSWVPGSSITVVANPRWYGPKPKSQTIVFKVIPSDNTLLANAQSHAINVYYFDPIEQVSQLEAIPGATVHFTVQPARELGRINFRDPQLRDIRVRQALEMAINRSALANQVWQKHATVIPALSAPDQWSFNPKLKPWPYSPTQAKKLLEQAGYKMGSNGYMQKNGKTLSIVWSTTAGNPWREASERLDQYWLKQIGVQMIIRNYPANAFFGTIMPAGTAWDVAEAENVSNPDPAATMQTFFTCSSPENFGRWCNTQFDALIAKQSTLLTQSQRQPILQQAESILKNQLPALWLYSPQEIDTSINLKGYVPNPYWVDTWNAYDWQVTK